MLKINVCALVSLISLVLMQTGWAQSNPSADALISALKPSAQSLSSAEARGLHRLMPPPEAPAAQAQTGGQSTRRVAPQTQTARPNAGLASASLYIQFSTGSATLTPHAMSALNELGKALTSNALVGYRFRIEGHTDTVGSKENNRELSERRAAAVVAYIGQKFGIDASRLVPIGLGSDQLLVPTADQTPEARNRRVQIVNIGA